MQCCPNCFESQTLRQFIENNGELGNCDFCLSESVPCLEVTELYPLFQPLLGLYRKVDYGRDYDEDGSPLDIGEELPSLIEDDWHPIFSDQFIRNVRDEDSTWFESERIVAFWAELFQENPSVLSSLWVERDLPESQLNSFWPRLSSYLKLERRFIIDDEELKQGIARLPEILERASITVPAGQKWFRARGGCNVDLSGKKIPFEKTEMGAPPPERLVLEERIPTGFLSCIWQQTRLLPWLKSGRGKAHMSPSLRLIL